MSKDDRELIERLRELLAKAELPPLVSADSPWVRDEQRTEIYHVMSNRNTDHEMVWARSRLVAEVRNALPTLLDSLEALQAQPVGEALGDYVAVRRDVISFLRGEGELDGQYYGDGTPPGEYRFWWRKYLAALTASPPVVGTTPGVNCPSCGHRLPVAYSGPCVACDAPNVLDLPGAPVVEREAIGDVAATILRDVCELDGYTSPDDQPDLLQCTTDELDLIVRRALGEDA